MTKEISPQEMLTEIVDAMMAGGYDPRKIEDVTWIDINDPTKDNADYEPTIDLVLRIKGFVPLSFNDLILNADAMKAVYGEEKVKHTFWYYGESIEMSTVAWEHHSLAAAKILLTTKDINKAIEYLFKEMKA